MRIYIPSRGRFDHTKHNPLVALQYMPGLWANNTTVVVHNSELPDYWETVKYMMSKGYLVGSPDVIGIDYDGIAEKRTFIGQHALKNTYKRFMMIDDDVNFLKRVHHSQVNQMTIKGRDDLGIALSSVSNHLSLYPQVALGLREGNNRSGVGPAPLLTEVTKAIRAVGYRTEFFTAVATDRVRTMSDYDTTLQILELGYKNAVLNYWMSGQRGTNTPGGCSIWRTHEVHNESVGRMAELHPGICRPRLKQNKTGGEFGTRMELTIGWKKAYEAGVKKYGARSVS